jgi:gliding motility-associated lipoprotein GldK
MKNLLCFPLLIAVLLLASCGARDEGQLIGVLDRPVWKPITPYGMVYIPSGSLHVGPSDQDINVSLTQRAKTISIQGFFMDDTEITNNEYRQFVYWVRDSCALDLLGKREGSFLDWEAVDELDYSGEELEPMFFNLDERVMGKRELNTSKFVYSYEWYDWKNAAQDYYWKNTDKQERLKYIKKEKIPIYPDTLCWVRDFSYSMNEPMARNYFWHPAFDDYPVVGIAWQQANAFAYWRTKFWNYERGKMGEINTEDFRLPTEHEWEYAARGGHDQAPYPWGGYYTRNAKGCLLANFKPGRGNYPEDGGLYTVRVDSYFPNDYGLYNMAGNVAEWTSSAYHENAYAYLHDLNPDYRFDAADDNPKEGTLGDPETWKRKVIRGGSWKDIAYFIQCGTRNYEFQDTTKSYIGFRCVLTFLGRSLKDFQ